MTQKLPPLNALRAFVFTARHMSATKAAAELRVTLGAVSHQLRALEEFLGVELFVRGHRQLTLTEAGARYFRDVSAAFETIRSATGLLRNPESQDTLRLRVYTTFSLRWLIPRLSRFYEENRSIELILSTGVEPVDFSREKLDFAVRLGSGDWPGVVAKRLITNMLAPVCSPSLLERSPVVGPADLKQHILLQSILPERRDDWSQWLQQQGVDADAELHFLYFESSAFSYQAAIEGQGFAMAQIALVEEELTAGRLVCPIPHYLDKGDFTYYLVYPENRRLTWQMSRFRDWLLAECDTFNKKL